MRTYYCRFCNAHVDVDYGIALWKALSGRASRRILNLAHRTEHPMLITRLANSRS